METMNSKEVSRKQLNRCLPKRESVGKSYQGGCADYLSGVAENRPKEMMEHL